MCSIADIWNSKTKKEVKKNYRQQGKTSNRSEHHWRILFKTQNKKHPNQSKDGAAGANSYVGGESYGGKISDNATQKIKNDEFLSSKKPLYNIPKLIKGIHVEKDMPHIAM